MQRGGKGSKDATYLEVIDPHHLCRVKIVTKGWEVTYEIETWD